VVKEAQRLNAQQDEDDSPDEPLGEFALFLRADGTLLVPKKTVAAVKYIHADVLADVHADPEVARELCLYFLSMMTRAYFEESKMVHLNANVLRRLFNPPGNRHLSGFKYVDVRSALVKGTPKNGPIIGYSEDFMPGVKSMAYWLTEGYAKVGFVSYEVTTDYVRAMVRRNYFELLSQAAENPIARNLFRFYSVCRMLTQDEARAEGERLAKAKAKNKKGKTLTMQHRKDKSYWKDADKRVFVEDSLAQYEYLTSKGLGVPIIGGERSGGRVYDTISLMPSWLRAAITVDGEELVELDYKALHPNLAMRIYGGSSRYITHDKVAEATGVARDDVKVQHLSFFNMRWDDIARSALYGYYMRTEPFMMEAMCRDKAENGYKATSRKMFKLEVELITEVITRLNKLGIYVGYAFDAIQVPASQAEAAEHVMNSVAREMGVYTATVAVEDELAHTA